MELIPLPGTDLRVSPLCYGGVSWGTGVRGDDMDRLIGAFRDAGGNFFDTAHCYAFWTEGGDGASERALAAHFRRAPGASPRDGVVIATKGGHHTTPSYRRVERHLSPERIAADLDDSLARLETDVIDLYWLHRDDPREAPGDVIETLNAEVRRGRIRYLGASNWPADRIDQANRYAREHGLRGFVANQPEWCLAEPNAAGRDATLRFLSGEDVAWHTGSKLPVTPYRPTAGGYFATGGRSAGAAFSNPTSRSRLVRAEKLAGDLGRTPNQVAMAYLTSHGFPVIPIIGTTKSEHLRDALGAVDVRLTPEQVRWLRDG